VGETKTVWISYTKLGGDVSRLDELLVIKPENFLCYSKSRCSTFIKLFFAIYSHISTQHDIFLSLLYWLTYNHINTYYINIPMWLCLYPFSDIIIPFRHSAYVYTEI